MRYAATTAAPRVGVSWIAALYLIAGGIVAATVAATLAAHLADRLRQQRRTASVERRYRTLVEELPLITYIDSPSGPGGSAAYVSPQIQEILGYTVDEWRAFPNFFTDHLHPADRKRVRE